MVSLPPELAALVGLAAAAPTPAGPPPVLALLSDHFGCDPTSLPVLTERIEGWNHVNVQVGLEHYLTRPGRSHRMVGVSVPMPAGGALIASDPPTLAHLLGASHAQVGAVDYVDLPCAPDATRPCIRAGLVLITGEDGPLAAWVRLDSPHAGRKVGLDVKAPTVAAAKAFIEELNEHIDAHSVFRGQVVSFTIDTRANVEPVFEPRPAVDRDEVVLPLAALEAIEEHTVGVAEAADDLRAAGRHLKRGLLLYGPPGTGKTLTTRYIVSRLPDAAVFYLTGSMMEWLRFVTGLAGRLAPAVVVLDDVDLIAEDRNLGGMAPRRHLFDLLDAMDGVHEDADLLFVCTTNRPETLETAIAARPGRIDLSVEVGLPDADCRRRLLERYAEGLHLAATDLEPIVARTEGATASFFKELLRRATLDAIARTPDGEVVTIDDHALAVALDSLLDPLTSLRPLSGAGAQGGAA